MAEVHVSFIASYCSQEENLVNANWAMVEEIPVDDQEREGKMIYRDHTIEVYKLPRKDVKKA